AKTSPSCSGRAVGKCSPACRRRPERIESFMSRARNSHNGTLRSIEFKSAERDKAGPRSHGARVVVAALCLIPWAALFTVVSRANIVDALDAFLNHSGIDHQCGRRV